MESKKSARTIVLLEGCIILGCVLLDADMVYISYIEAEYCPSSHYWAKYPELYGGAYGIKEEILDHEVNKFSLCDNTHAKEAYGWVPQVDIETGLARVIEAECKMLAARDNA